MWSKPKKWSFEGPEMFSFYKVVFDPYDPYGVFVNDKVDWRCGVPSVKKIVPSGCLLSTRDEGFITAIAVADYKRVAKDQGLGASNAIADRVGGTVIQGKDSQLERANEFYDFFGELTKLKKNGSVKEYQNEFEKLLAKAGYLSTKQARKEVSRSVFQLR
ncbi:hypothetical protein GIB67_027756 [Kingdonia uniflora]|uniref:Uncharacterized protein n=1 Tax=Kingdonia uniflora TaxID=39325 RepID=A0A7J7PC13_9MAGN|nr:hypothetical protein GIB67_027756 [Kingdonia uniflora]